MKLPHTKTSPYARKARVIAKAQGDARQCFEVISKRPSMVKTIPAVYPVSPLKFNIQRNQPVRLPDGRITRVNLINHPGAVLIAPFLNKQTVVMMLQFRPVLKKYIYELPAGTLEKGEPAARCARRELLEETGLKAARLTKLGGIYPVPGYSTEMIHIFKAEGLTLTQAQPEDYEVIEIVPMGRREVRKLLDKGKLMDAKSICALVLCGWL